MPSQTLILPAKADSWNVLVGKHFRSVVKIKDYWKMLTIQAIQKYNIKPVTSFPCQIEVQCRFKFKKQRDVDSIYFKACQDQLVTSKILPDDCLQYVDKVTYSGMIGAENDEIIITLSYL
jgi:hypothetical protein